MSTKDGAGPARKQSSRTRNARRMRFFFYEGKLYRKLKAIPPRDIMYAWSYEDQKQVMFVYSHIRKVHERAWHTQEVASMLNRSRHRVVRYIHDGAIPPPAQAHSLTGEGNRIRWMWSEADIIGLHDYLLSTHYGRPRNDGINVPRPTPSRPELRAMLKHEMVYYVKDKDGNMVKAFKDTTW